MTASTVEETVLLYYCHYGVVCTLSCSIVTCQTTWRTCTHVYKDILSRRVTQRACDDGCISLTPYQINSTISFSGVAKYVDLQNIFLCKSITKKFFSTNIKYLFKQRIQGYSLLFFVWLYRGGLRFSKTSQSAIIMKSSWENFQTVSEHLKFIWL